MKILLTAIIMALTSTMAFADDELLSLNGVGSVAVEPDEGYISVGIAVVAPTSSEAVAKNTASMKKLFERLNALHIEKSSIKTLDFSLSEHYKVETIGKDLQGNPITKNVKDGFVVSNTILVTVCDLPQFGKVLDTIVQDEVNSVGSISFGSSKAQENTDKARALAVKDALRKAKILTDGLGVKLGHVVRITESSARLGGMAYKSMAMDSASSGEVPVSGGTLSFNAIVNVSWELDQGEEDLSINLGALKIEELKNRKSTRLDGLELRPIDPTGQQERTNE